MKTFLISLALLAGCSSSPQPTIPPPVVIPPPIVTNVPPVVVVPATPEQVEAARLKWVAYVAARFAILAAPPNRGATPWYALKGQEKWADTVLGQWELAADPAEHARLGGSYVALVTGFMSQPAL